MIETLFPAVVVAVEAVEAHWESPLLPEEAACVTDAGPRRRRQFAAGRACAREALARLGLPPAPLLRAADRSPRWPPGIVGSISHCADRCAAAVARATDLGGVGLDLERAGRVTERLLPRLASPSERARLGGWPASAGDARSLLFSAKEAVYKCVSGRLRAPLGWHDVDVELDPRSGAFRASLLEPAAQRHDLPPLLEGRFACEGGYVAAGVTLPPR